MSEEADRAERGVLRSRTVRTRDGRQWTVREVAAAHVPGAKGARCLIFDRGDLLRRLWRYPRHWDRLDTEELMSLPVQRD